MNCPETVGGVQAQACQGFAEADLRPHSSLEEAIMHTSQLLDQQAVTVPGRIHV